MMQFVLRMQSLGWMCVKYRADSKRRAIHSLRMSGRNFWDCDEWAILPHVKEAVPALLGCKNTCIWCVRY